MPKKLDRCVKEVEKKIKKGEIAAKLADMSDGSEPNKTAAGQQRGDIKDKDSYMSAIFSLNYKFRWKKRRRSRPKF